MQPATGLDYHKLIRENKLLDIISVGETNYAIAAEASVVSGCTLVLAHQLAEYLALFIREGFSRRFNTPYHVLAGLSVWSLFSYSLAEQEITNKQAFSHALMGTGGRAGMLTKWSGRKLGRGSFLVPLEHEGAAREFLAHWSIVYTTEVILRGD